MNKIASKQQGATAVREGKGRRGGAKGEGRWIKELIKVEISAQGRLLQQTGKR